MIQHRLPGIISLVCILSAPIQVHAQGVVRGAQEGAAAGNRAAGPVGGAVGGAVGGVFGGVAGGVKGVLGIPQNTSTAHSGRARRTSTLSRPSIRSELIGRPLKWTNADGTQSGTTVFYTDNTASLMNSNLASGPEDQGRWTLKSNRLCVTWEKIRNGEESCTVLTRTGPKSFQDTDGITFTSK